MRDKCLPYFDAVFKLSETEAFRSSPLERKSSWSTPWAPFPLGAHVPMFCRPPHPPHHGRRMCRFAARSVAEYTPICTHTNNGTKSIHDTNRADLLSPEFSRQCDTPHPTKHYARVYVGTYSYEAGRQGVPWCLGCASQRVAAVPVQPPPFRRPYTRPSQQQRMLVLSLMPEPHPKSRLSQRAEEKG